MTRDEAVEIVLELLEGEGYDLYDARDIERVMNLKADWADAAYILVSTWYPGSHDAGLYVEPLDGELTGLIDKMQNSLDHAGGDYGYYGVYVLDFEGNRYNCQITAVELV